jgi:hypothetical protein
VELLSMVERLDHKGKILPRDLLFPRLRVCDG